MDELIVDYLMVKCFIVDEMVMWWVKFFEWVHLYDLLNEFIFMIYLRFAALIFLGGGLSAYQYDWLCFCFQGNTNANKKLEQLFWTDGSIIFSIRWI